MNASESAQARQIAEAASAFQQARTGHAPKAVTVVLSEDTLVITLHEALTPAERDLAQSAVGAARVQEFHRQLFSHSSESLRQEIKRITGRDVREAVAEIELATGAIVHAFTTGTMVQVFLLARPAEADAGSDHGPVHDDQRGRQQLHARSLASGGPDGEQQNTLEAGRPSAGAQGKPQDGKP